MAGRGRLGVPARPARPAIRAAVSDPAALIRTLARSPRPAGSRAEARARRHCAAVLEAYGFKVAERGFEYSSWPGRFGAPVLGGALLAGGLAALAGSRASRPAPGASTALGIATLGGLVAWAALRFGTSHIAGGRRRGTNLEARRDGPGGEAPRVWLVAHLDSKSQRCSLGARAAGAGGSAAAWAGIAALVLSGRAASAPRLVAALGAAAATAAVPLAIGFVGGESPGALDNASGVATVLAAVAALPATLPLGVLVTSAEELALAGSRAWLRNPDAGGAAGRDRRGGEAGRGQPGVAINCDGVDDAGTVVLTVAGDPRGELRSALRQLAGGGDGGGGRPAVRPAVRRLLPGVVFDAVAFSDAGWAALTVSRGTWRSLRRVHTARDRVELLRGDGIPGAAALVARLVRAVVVSETPGHAAAPSKPA